MQSHWDTYADYGFIVLAAWSENTSRTTPSLTDIQSWVSYYGVDYPNLIDPSGNADRIFDPSQRTRPTYVLLSPGLVIEQIGSSVTTASIEAVLPISYP